MAEQTQVQTKLDAEAQAGLYLTFALGDEMYGVEILAVQEIIQMVPITIIPRTPPFVRGVINLRGKVIPVVDLRRKFGMEATEDTSQTCIVVVQVTTNDQAVTLGVVVDRVAEVLEVGVGQVEPPPSFGATVDTDFIRGMGKVGDKVIILLDICRVLAGEELVMVGQMAREE